jgi:hypothetical protein
MGASHEIWAVIAGLDHYPDQPNWLNGAAGDALRMRKFLIDKLKVAEDHIDLLLLPHPWNKPTGLTYKQPSRVNILSSLADTCLQAQPGDTVWFCYAGHGDRVNTLHPSLKQDTKVDEVICAADHDITDVELDAALGQFVQKGIQTLAVLDCCHSGGTTRDRDGVKFRYRIKNGEHFPEEGPAVSRNTKVRETWFYQHRKYRLIAACQPYQKAGETLYAGQVQGKLTRSLLDIFSATSDVRRMPLKTIQQRLDVLFSQNIFQNPMVLGDGDSTIGGTRYTPYAAVSITVSQVDQFKITLDKGAAAGVNVGDVYELHAPEDDPKSPAATTILMTATVSSVGGLQSWCHYQNLSNSIANVKIGYVACLLSKASLVTVSILDEPSLSQLQPSRQTLTQQLASEATSLLPFAFFDAQVAAPSANTDYSISFAHDSQLKIYDINLQPLTPTPCIKHDDEHLLKKVTSVLRHIHAFCTLRDLKPSAKYKKPLYDFGVSDVGTDDTSSNPKVISSKQVMFKNLEPLSKDPSDLPETRFITILNLTSAFGVYQVFPYDDAQSIAVEPQNEIPMLIVDVELPDIFDKQGVRPPIELRDTLKVFITSKQQSFGHYLQNDLKMVGGELGTNLRRVRARSPQTFEWWCDQLDIMTPLGNPKGGLDQKISEDNY